MRDRELFDDEVCDALLALFGRHLFDRHPSLLEEDDRFMTWLARDIRRRPPAADDWDASRVRRVRRRVVDRALGERFRVPLGDGAPAMREAPAAPIARALDDALRARCAPWTSLAAAAGEGRELWDEECDRWVELPRFVEGGRYVALQVAGDSMTPLLHAGDTILVRLGNEVERDRIVVARRPESGYVVKRVGRVDRRTVELLSLNPAYAPVRVPRRRAAILGTVIMRWCVHDTEAMSTIPRR
jgi:hypothetical protein